MKKNKLLFIIILVVISFATLSAELIQLKQIKLSKKNGGYANGESWNSNSLLGKTNLIIYVDPDKMSDIKDFVSILEEKKFNKNKVDITYIVNTKATIIPTFIIKSKIKERAENDKEIAYVLDNDKVLVKNWQLTDNSANVLILSKRNRQLYHYSKKMNDKQIEIVLSIVENEMNKKNKLEEK
ncbi:MAG: YtfJ family protein [Candidatus Cloacimonadota bacterium]|nr:YtfJ family protein [Candidatus Cloacimonadota bacterium]